MRVHDHAATEDCRCEFEEPMREQSIFALKSVGIIDQTLAANEGGSWKWKNSEVRDMLLDIRMLILEDFQPELAAVGSQTEEP